MYQRPSSFPIPVCTSLVSLLTSRAAEHPALGYTFLADGESVSAELTYAGLDRRARSIGAWLRELGGSGERVLLLYPPGLDFIAAFFGCLYAGAVAVPAYPPRLKRSDTRLQAIARDCQPRIVLTIDSILARATALTEQSPELAATRWLSTDGIGEELAQGADLPEPDADALALLQYTSGSTGTPKGVKVSHAALLHNEEMIRRAFGQSEESVVVGWLPLYHDMGLIGNVLQPLYSGSRCVLMPPVAFLQKPLRWLRAISDFRGTTSGGPSFAYGLCVDRIGPEQLDLSSWRLAFNGSEPVRPETMRRFAEAFAPSGFRAESFYPCYGLAEATLFVSGGGVGAGPQVRSFAAGALEEGRAEPAGEAGTERELVSCGQAWMEQRIVIADPESGTECPAGRVGEIWVEGPSVAGGYWGREEESDRVFRAFLASGEGPFLRTGDLGFLAGGELFVTGRLKDLIIVRGRNVYPQDVERTAEESCPDLRAASSAAFAVDAVEKDGEERLVVVCEVERRPGTAPAEIAERVRRAVTGEHEVPVHEVVLIRPGALPKTSSGKVQRQACRSLYLADELEVVASSIAAPPPEPALERLDRKSLLALSPEERRPLLIRHLAARIGWIQQTPRLLGEQIDPEAPLTALGIDSLGAAELAQAVGEDLAIPLELSEMLSGVTVAGLATAVLERLDGADIPGGAQASSPAPERRWTGGDAPLSLGQAGLWFLDRLSPGSAAYNLASAARTAPGLEPEALRRAFQALCDRHPALRTTFHEGSEEPVQRVHERLEADFQVVEAGGWSASRLEEELAAEAFRPFELDSRPPIRLSVFLGPQEGPVVLLVVHHIVADLWSLGVILRELGLLYARESEGTSIGLLPLELTYTDYVLWQRERLAGPEGERLWQYWKGRLAGELPVLDLPTDRPRRAAMSDRGGAAFRTFPPGLEESVRRLARDQGATLFTTVLAAFRALLYRYSGQEDLIVGTPTTGRSARALANLVGYFVNPIALRADLSGNPSFLDLLTAARREALEAFAHQEYPLPLLTRKLQPERETGQSPLFQVVLALQQSEHLGVPGLARFSTGEPGTRLDFGPLAFEALPLAEGRSAFDLSLMLAADRDGLAASLQFRSDLYDEQTAARLLGHLEILLAAAAADPALTLHALPLLSAAERRQILEDWNAATLPVAGEMCLHELFAAQAARTPEACALIAGEERLTYREVQARVRRLARHLRRLGVGPETRVGVFLDRTPDLVVSLFAVLEAGGAYVPVDPAYPRSRSETILADAAAAAVLTRRSLANQVPGDPVRLVCVDELPAGDAEGAGEMPARPAVPGNLAYLIYTSGSTGRPKGIAIQHRNAVALMRWVEREFQPADLSGVLASTSICFDMSIFEIFGTLSYGGTVILARDVLELPALPALSEVTFINTVPSAMTELMEWGRMPASVRVVGLGGEPLPDSLVRKVHALSPDLRVYNLYGPSEDTTYSTICVVPRQSDRPPTVGRPVDGTRAYVLDARGGLAPVGVPGELYLGGEGLARGYLDRPDLTAERFIPDAIGTAPGARLYRTGDLTRFLPDGEIEYLGRMDHQVKVRGFRVELGEIETVLGRHPAVQAVMVVARQEPAGSLRLVAYAVPGEGAGEDLVHELGDLARRELPEYMVPSAWGLLESFPHTPSGKVDRRALPAPEELNAETAADYEPPVTPFEELLADLWRDLLGVQRVGRRDDFFNLGGHSLLGTRLVSRIRSVFGVELPLTAIFEAPELSAFAERLEAAQAAASAAALPLQPVSREGGVPLSFAQQRLWFLDQLEPGRTVYNVALDLRLEGTLDETALLAALREITRRHESLRTVFQAPAGEPVQVISPDAEPRWERTDLSHLPPEAAWREGEELALALARQPFDLSRGPLLRVLLLRLGESRHRLAVVTHHSVADGWSTGIFLRELAALYEAFVEGRPSPLPPLPIQYADFAVWQRAWLQGEVLDRQVGYWRQQLADPPEPLELPLDHPRGARTGDCGGLLDVSLPAPLAHAVEELARHRGATSFMALLALFATLLHRLTGREDLCVGTPIANRSRAELEGLIGFFVNTLVMRARPTRSLPFEELLVEVRRTALQAYMHQDVPFEKLVEELQPDRLLGRQPFFQVLLALQNYPQSVPQIPGLGIEAGDLDGGTARFDLSLLLTRATSASGVFTGVLSYNADLLDRPTTARWFRHLEALAEGAVAAPSCPLSELALLSAPERHQVISEWNDTAGAAPVSILDRFEEHVRRAPEALALRVGEEMLTYGELDARANRVARRLVKMGVDPDTTVGLCLERSLEVVVAILAAFKAGGAYVPLDPQLPAERLARMIEDAAPRVVVTRTELAGALPPETPVLRIEDVAGGDALPPPLRSHPESLAYVLFTSGSTGRPKGVAVEHRQLAGYAAAVLDRLGLPEGSSFASVSTLSADLGNTSVYGALASGGTLHLLPEEVITDAATMAGYFTRHSVDCLKIVPSHLAALLGEPGEAQPLPRRALVLGGEAFPRELAERLRGLAPDLELFNHYGPTEATVGVLAGRAGAESGAGTVPLGRPLGGCRVWILDISRGPLPPGVPGELCIGGRDLARGYLARPDLTAERFVPDPVSGLPGERLYRTGDLARVLADGRIEFLGRIDHQVKLRGYRVEPGEIEAALTAHPGVREAAVVLVERGGERRLVAWAALAGDRGPSAAELRSWLLERLPEYMVPAAIVFLEALPRTPNGKLDRRALTAPADLGEAAAGGELPSTQVETLLAGIWEDVLGVPRVGLDDSFFDLGGHSLLATRTVSRIRSAFGVEIPLRSLFENPTLRGFAAGLQARLAGGVRRAEPLQVPEAAGPAPLSFSQERLWFLLRLNESASAAYNLAYFAALEGPLDAAVLERSLAWIVERHAELRAAFPESNRAPARVIHPPGPWTLPRVDLEALPEPLAAGEARRLAAAEARRPFDIARGPLVRATLLRRSPGEHVLLLSLHHMVSDAWSRGVLMRELSAVYEAFAAGRPSPLPPLPLQYADYARWQRQHGNDEELERQLAYWRHQLGTSEPVLDLPLDRPRPAAQGFHGGRFDWVPAASSPGLQAFARRRGATSFMVLLAGLQLLLHRYSGQESISVGSPIANRNRAEAEPLIGFLVNTLVLRTDLSGEPEFGDLLARVRRVALEAYAHQDVPFERVVEAVQPERQLGRTPLFQVVLALQNAPIPEMRLGDVAVRSFPVDGGTAKFDLTFMLEDMAAGIRGWMEYDTDLFDRATVARIFTHLETLLAAGAANPDQRISELPLLTALEQYQLLEGWNDTAPAGLHEEPACLHELFETQAARTPGAVAVVWGGARLTYGQLDRLAGRVAARLRRLGVGPETRVGICLKRTPRLVAALFGVLKAGGAYVPLDPTHPAERLAWALADGRAAVLVTEESLAGLVPDGGPQRLLLDGLEDWPDEAAAEPGAAAGPGNLAYVIYTSGSTGRPKGIAIEHRSAVAMVRWTGEVFSPADLAGAVASTSITFDVSVFELFGPLSHGGRIVLVDDVLTAAGEDVTLLTAVPSAVMELVRARVLPATIRTVGLGGEAVSRSLVGQLYDQPGVERVVNLYGPSEDTTYSTFAVLSPERDAVPVIGRPIRGTRAYILDRRLQLVPLGVAGELFLGGAGLSRGYLDRPGLTAERFLPDPFGQEPGGRLYRTGDLVRYRSDGNLDYLGRIDHQVKVRGFRIELGEMEEALRSHPAVRQAAVVARQDGAGDASLAAFLVPESTAAGALEEVRAALGRRLPSYMVPATFTLLNEMPLTTTGKIDRRALAALEPEREPSVGGAALLQGPVEELIAGFWTEALGIPRPDRGADFFELGGHSLAAVRVASRIRETFGVDLPLRALFEAPTVEDLARRVVELRGGDSASGLSPVLPVPRPADGAMPLSLVQRRLWFLARLEPESASYNMPVVLELDGPLDLPALAGALLGIVRRHEVLRSRFPLLGEEPSQIASPPDAVLAVPEIDLRNLREDCAAIELERLSREEAVRPFNVESGPMLRAKVVRCSASRSALLLTVHHLVADGGSVDLFLRELETLYGSLAGGMAESPLQELPVQYADFAVWQRQTLTPETLARPLAWWRDRLAELPALDLPADHARPAAARLRGSVETLALAPETVGRVEELANQAGATRFMVLLAAFQALLYRYTGQRDFAIGTPVAQRDRRELEGLIGFFVNMLVMRARPFGDQPFADLIARVREGALAAHEHRQVPYELLVEELRPGRGAGRKTLFEAVFAHQETSLELHLQGLSTRLRSLEHGTSKFDLSLVTLGEDGGLSLLLEYSTDRFEQTTARRILTHFAEMLRGAAAAPGTRLTDLPLLSSEEISELVVEGGAVEAAQGGRPAPVPVHKRIEERARRAPGALAVAHGRRRLTYAALDRWANRVARELRAQGAGPDRIVGVLFEPCPERVVACLAALKAGATYLPLDPAHPAERLALTLEDAAATALLTRSGLRGMAPEGVPVLCLDESEGPPEPGHPDGESLGIEVPPEAGAYVIYTSGSTGRPKGSLLTHAGLANLVDWYLETCRMAPSDRVTQFAGPAFDVSILDIWPPLCAGSSLHCADRDLLRSPAALWRWMAEERITLSFLSTPVAEAAMEEPLPEEGLSLRVLSTGGDRLHRWLRPDLPFVLVNLYGPSEVTVVSTFAVLTPGEEGDSAPPIGRPVTNLRVVLLDGDLRPVPKGAPGEIYVGGVGVGRGYLGRPDLTAERFVPDPLADEPGSRLYRTGDRARLLPSRDLDFLGRIDFQVKIRGFRVEPGEIEVVLGAHPAVRQSVVLAVEDEPGSGARLVAYVALDGIANPEELRQHLASTLPDPMVPADILLVPELPLTPNGKVDRKALPELHGTRSGRTSSAVAPRTPTEVALAGLWADLLRREPTTIAVDDDFFELGGHSLMATRLLSRIRQIFRIDPLLRELFEAPTLAEMATRLDAYQAAAEAPPLRPRERGERGRLSFTQERLWLLDRLEPGAAYNMPAAVALRGRLDVQALERSLAQVVRRHESLRTVFRDEAGAPYQTVEPSVPVRLEVTDLSALPPAEGEREAVRLAAEEALRPFDLAAGPLFRTAVLRLGESEHRLLLTLHHIIADGWSMGVLVDEITALYLALAETGGEVCPLPDLPLQYGDFVEWQRDWLQGETLEKELGLWTARLENPPAPLDLPTDFPRPRVQTYRGGRRSLTLPAGLTGDLAALARSSGATPFMVLLAGFSVLLRRWSGSEDLIVGSPVAGRTRPEVEGLIGVFVNTLALRVDLSGHPSFQTLLERVREVALEAYAHQEVPFEAILSRVQVERDASRTPLFQVFLNMLNLEPRKLRLPGCELEALSSGEMPSKFDLTLYAAERESSLRFDLVYNADLFLPERVEEMLRQLASVLAQAFTDPARPVDRLSLLTAESAAVLPDPQQPIERVWEGPAHQALTRHALRQPQRVALADRRGEWTYAEFETLAGRLAGRLRETGVGRGDVVAVWAHRSAALALALAGAHRAGAAFTVLDPAYPPVRLAAALRLARPVAWLRLEAAPDPAGEVEEALGELPLRCRIDLPGTPSEAAAEFAAFPSAAEVAVGPDDLAYVAFTSGSTGTPKGILGNHGPLSHFLGWHSRTFGLAADDRFSLLSGLAHDPLLRDIFTPLWVGAALCIPDPQEMESGRRLARWMGEQGITVSHLTPALAELLATAPEENGIPSLRHAFFGGDVLRRRTVEGLRRLAGAAACVNFYGATETPQAMGWLPVDPAPAGREEVPVGRGIEGVQLLVLGSAGDLAGVGEIGEIHIRTPYLSQGYLGDEALTRERFLANMLYRTGDLGRYLPDGTVEFAGRDDGQVKLRGFRIELGEIEAAFAAHPRVLTAAALLLEDPAGEKRLAAYVVPDGKPAPPASELRAFLGERLPDYMVPSAFVELPALPLTPNGKLDRRRLPAPDWSAAPAAEPADPPQDPIEEVTCEILAQLLGRERIGRSESFFELGGHSLLAARLLAQLETAFAVSLSLREVFLAPTAEGIATLLRERLGRPAGGGATLPRVEPAPADLALPFPMTDVQQAYWVGRTGAIELGKVASHRYLELESDDLDVGRLANAWRRLIDRHGMLRAVVDADGGQRILAEVPAYAIEEEDLSRLPAEEAEQRLADLREELSHQVFRTDRWPLFEIRTCRLPEGRVRLFFSFDYLIGDAWSFQVLLRELLWLYHDPAATLPPLELSFRDYVMALERLRESDLYARAREYWRERLPSLPGGPEFPLVLDPALLEEQRFARRRAWLEPEAWRRLKARGAAAGLTPSGLLLAVFSEVLGTWTRSPRFSLVLTLFGRLPMHPQVNDLVGDFTSTTLLTVERGEPEHFETRARHLQERLWNDLDHRYFSGVQVMRELASRQGGRLRSVTPVVFTSTLDLREAGGGSAPELPGRVVYGVSQTPQILLDHQAAERQGGLVLNWDAVEEVFPPGYLDDMFEAYQAFLGRLAEGDGWQDRSFRLVTDRQLGPRNAANDTAAPIPPGLLHEPFADQVRRDPGRVAVICGERVLTYGELDQRAEALAQTLRALGTRPNRLVGVVMEKGWEQAVAVVAILRAGGAYLPIDAELPKERLWYLLHQGEVEVAITQPRYEAGLEWPEDVRRIAVDPEPPAAPVVHAPQPPQDPEDLAYVIFTSGSTGMPKGVMTDHRGALNTIVDLNERFALGEDDRVLGLSALNFDLSVYDIFGLLAAGGALVLPEPGERRDPSRWERLLLDHRVTVWNTVPALMEMLVEYLEGCGRPMPPSLRLVMMSGDWIPVGLPARIRALAPEICVWSLGGATEASIWSILYPIEEVDPNLRSIPYGKAMVNQTFHVLDEGLDPSPTWVPGELYIGGIGLAKGYWRDPEKTARSFITHPSTGERLYRTGDLGRYLPSGDIEFLGREDFQVKIQGHRIELGEIESALLQHPDVRTAVVNPIGTGTSRRLVAYVVSERRPEPPAQAAEPAPSPLPLPEGPAEGGRLDPLQALKFKLGQPGLRREPDRPLLALARRNGGFDPLEAYERRRTRRSFSPAALPASRLGGMLLQLAQVPLASRRLPGHLYPSAGSLYPVQVYLHLKPGAVEGLPAGTYYYNPAEHALVPLVEGALIGRDAHSPVNRAVADAAGLTLLLIGDLDAIAPVYGDMARDFCLLEAGYIGQLLMTTSLEARIGLCPVGRMDFEPLRPLFDLKPSHCFLHAFLAGLVDETASPAALPGRPASAKEDLSGPLRRFLEGKLPHYMVPSAFVFLDTLPLTSNGKVDRRALPEPDLHGETTGGGHLPPENGVERSILEIWKRVLQLEMVGRHDNFFELGGNSVTMIQVYNQLREILGGDIPLVTLFEHPTASSLARHLSDREGAEAAGAANVERGQDRADRRREAARQKAQRRRPRPGMPEEPTDE